MPHTEKGGVLQAGSPGEGIEGVHQASQLKERQKCVPERSVRLGSPQVPGCL